MSDSLWPHAHQAPRPWNSPGKNTGMGCHFLLHLSPESHKLNLNPQCDIRTFRKQLGHEGRVLVNGISAHKMSIVFIVPIKKGLQKALSFSFCHMRTQWEDSSLWTKKWVLRTAFASALILDFPVSRTIRNKCCLSNPGRRKWQPTPKFLPGESHGERNLVGYNL